MKVPYSELKKGTFLVASPDITNGIFFRCVVLLCDHSPVGSFGLIINKPLEVDLESDLLEMSDLEENQVQMRAGGPNQPNQIMLLQSFGGGDESSLEVCEGVYLNGDVDTLQTEDTQPEASPSLLCFGYGGWSAGALEREFLSGAWYLHPASSQHVFETPPEVLWQTLLREMGGKYKTLSMMPEDLDLN